MYSKRFKCTFLVIKSLQIARLIWNHPPPHITYVRLGLKLFVSIRNVISVLTNHNVPASKSIFCKFLIGNQSIYLLFAKNNIKRNKQTFMKSNNMKWVLFATGGELMAVCGLHAPPPWSQSNWYQIDLIEMPLCLMEVLFYVLIDKNGQDCLNCLYVNMNTKYMIYYSCH